MAEQDSILTDSNSLYNSYDYFKIVDIMKKHYPVEEDFTLPEGLSIDDFYYNKATEIFPEYNLAPLDSLKNDKYKYPADPDSIDLSPEKVNSIWGMVKDTASSFINDISKEAKERTEAHMGFIEEQKKIGEGVNLAEMFVDPDSWAYLENNKPLRDAISVGVNNSVPGLLYNSKKGKDLYDVDMEKYDPTFLQNSSELLAAYSDPATIFAIFAGFGVGGSAHRSLFGTLKGAPSVARTWWAKATGNHIIKTIPKVQSNSLLKKNLSKLMNSKYLENTIFTTGGMATSHSIMGIYQSLADQRMNRGKYETNDSTINSWDTMNDAWDSYKDGATIGFLLSGVNQSLAFTNIWSKARWKMGRRDFKTLTGRAVSNPVSKLGIEGLTFTTMPMALDEEVRKQYYDANGDFKTSKFLADWGFNNLSLGFFWGIQKTLIPHTTYIYHDTPFTKGKSTMENIRGLPVNRGQNFGQVVRGIKKDIVKDIKHENNKIIDVEYRNTETKLLQQSIKDIKKDLGPETPFDFFDKDIDIETELVETVQGLKGIREIVDNTVRILDKAGTKDKNDNYIEIDTNKLTEDDIAYLHTVSLNGVTAYQGYRTKYYETTEGQEEYIKRYESEVNQGRKLSDAQRKSALLALEIRINQFDVMKHDLNTRLTEGLNKSEQIQKENKSELDEDKVDIIAVDEEGNATTGNVLTLNKSEAKQKIEQGEAISVEEADKKGIKTKEVESYNHGQLTPEAMEEFVDTISERVAEAVLEKVGDVTENIPKNIVQYENITKGIKGNELENIPELKGKETATSNIKDPYDVAILKDNFSGKDLAKRLPIINKILGASKKNSITELTTDDVEGFLDKHKKTLPLKGINPNMTSNITIVFNELRDKGFIKNVPLTAKRVKEYTAEYNAALRKKKAEQPLPELKEWYGKIPQIKKLMKSDKSFNIALDLISQYAPIRAEEINAMKGKHVVLHTPTGKYYIDLMQVREAKGMAKYRGRKRPVFIPKELAFKLQGLTKNPNALLFPNFTGKLSTATKKVFGIDYLTSKAYKEQEKLFAETQANLTSEEREIYLQIAGHGSESKISQYYLQRGNWADLFKLQEKVLTKIARAREEFLQEPGAIETITGKVIEVLKKPGLSIEDVSGKTSNEIINISRKEAKKSKPDISVEAHKKLVETVKEKWDALTERMLVDEKRQLMNYFARDARIKDYANFGTSSGNLTTKNTLDEIIAFADMFIGDKEVEAYQSKRVLKNLRYVNTAKQILEDNNISIEGQKRFLKETMKFFPNTPLDKVDAINLTFEQAKQYHNYVASYPGFKVRDKFDYVVEALNEDTIAKISRRAPGYVKAALYTGFLGQVEDVFPWIAKKANLPGLVQIGHDLATHDSVERVQGGKKDSMEHAIWKLIYDDAVARGVSTIILTQPTTIPRKQKRRYMYGKKVFDKTIKDGLVYLDPIRYNNLVEHVKTNPSDKVAAERLKKIKPFIKQVYILDAGKSTGKLKIDTLESKIAREFYKYTKGNWNSITSGFQMHMTEANWETFKKTKSIAKEIVEHFYVPRAPSKEFLESYDLTSRDIDALIEKMVPDYAMKLAKEKYGDVKLTDKQIKEFEAKARIEAGKDTILINNWGVAKFQARNLMRRKMYLGERLFVNGKWIDGYEWQYDRWMPNYNASTAKLIANIELFPYMLDIPGLSKYFKRSYPSVLKKVSKSGVFGSYINDMILSRTGITPRATTGQQIAINWVGGKIGTINTYISRTVLSNLYSPTKNYTLALQMDALRFDYPEYVRTHARALSFKTRMEVQAKTGMMGVSYSAITENDNSFGSRAVEWVFTGFRFPTSEQISRAGPILQADLFIPCMVDGIRGHIPAITKNWLDFAKNEFYLSDRQIELLKEYGLGGTEVDWKGEESPSVKALEGKRFKKVDGKASIQKELDQIHGQIWTRAHTITQGSTSEIYQPWMMQNPIINGLALYTKMAYNGFVNTLKGARHSYKNNTWTNQILFWTIAYGLTDPILTAIKELFDGTAKPGELDREWWRVGLRKLSIIEYGGIHAWIWGLTQGETPLSNPYLPSAAISAMGEFFELLVEGTRTAAEKTGVAPKYGPFAKYFIKQKRFKQAPKDFVKSVVGAYNQFYEKAYKMHKYPYRQTQQRIDTEFEQRFYTDIKPLSKPKIVLSTTMSPYYREVKNKWETISYNKKNDTYNFNDFNEILMLTFEAKFDEKKRNGESNESANEYAVQAIKSKLTALNPLLNGIGFDIKKTRQGIKLVKTKSTKLISDYDAYQLYLKETARIQLKKKIIWGTDETTGKPKDENYYINVVAKQLAEYIKRIDAWNTQFPGWVQHNYKNHDFKESIKKLYPESWSKLGIGLE